MVRPRDISRSHGAGREPLCLRDTHPDGSAMTVAVERAIGRAGGRPKGRGPVIDMVVRNALWTKRSHWLRGIKRDGVTSVSSWPRNATHRNRNDRRTLSLFTSRLFSFLSRTLESSISASRRNKTPGSHGSQLRTTVTARRKQRKALRTRGDRERFSAVRELIFIRGRERERERK